MGAAGPWSERVAVGRRSRLFGELVRPGVLEMAFGRHFRTASTDARQGCICKGTENVTSTTMAALAIVEAIEGESWVSC